MYRLLLFSAIIFLSGCAINKELVEPQDPYEAFNRRIFAFNMASDSRFLKPVAKVYDKVLPNPAKKGIHNFFSNIGNIANVANDILQVNFHQAAVDSCRFVFNSTIGIGGLVDVAAKMGLPYHHQDFGLTLAKWGSKKSPYLVLPFIGPSTVRDIVGLGVNYQVLSIWGFIEPPELRYGLEAVDIVSMRARLLGAEHMMEQAFDPYIFVRNAYLQRRAHYIDQEANDVKKFKDDNRA